MKYKLFSMKIEIRLSSAQFFYIPKNHSDFFPKMREKFSFLMISRKRKKLCIKFKVIIRLHIFTFPTTFLESYYFNPRVYACVSICLSVCLWSLYRLSHKAQDRWNFAECCNCKWEVPFKDGINRLMRT